MAPRSVAEGPAKRGSGSGGDASTAPQFCWSAGISLRGRTIRVVAFAHPIPQTHRRASGDLFSASLTFIPYHSMSNSG